MGGFESQSRVSDCAERIRIGRLIPSSAVCAISGSVVDPTASVILQIAVVNQIDIGWRGIFRPRCGRFHLYIVRVENASGIHSGDSDGYHSGSLEVDRQATPAAVHLGVCLVVNRILCDYAAKCIEHLQLDAAVGSKIGNIAGVYIRGGGVFQIAAQGVC